MRATITGCNPCARGCKSITDDHCAGGGAWAVLHSGQSSMKLGAAVESSLLGATSFMPPPVVHTNSRPLCNPASGEAMAAAKVNAKHASIQWTSR